MRGVLRPVGVVLLAIVAAVLLAVLQMTSAMAATVVC